MTTRSASSTAPPRSALMDRLVELGARHDAVPTFPAASLCLLADAGLHRRFAPPSAGGDEWSSPRDRHRALLDALRFVGRADLSLGRLYEGHVNALLLFDWYARPGQHEWLNARLGRGAWFGVWATEASAAVRLSAAGKRLTGAKTFASGAGGLDFAIVTAAPEQGERRLVVVPADVPERADTSHWRVRGMRASGSGRYDLEDMEVSTNALLGEAGDYDREPRFTAGAWRFCAVQLGGIEALLIETRAAMSEAARGDPIQRARFADAVAAMRTAGFWVREAADRAADEDLDAIAIVRMTRGIVERAALDVMELAARILGTRSAFDGERADKIIRDLSLYLRQGGPDHARDQAALAWLDHDPWADEDRLW